MPSTTARPPTTGDHKGRPYMQPTAGSGAMKLSESPRPVEYEIYTQDDK